jgi:hypothetical protein
MNKGNVKQLFQSPSTYRIPKLVTLMAASCTLLAMVSIDASASTSAAAGTAGTVVLYHSSAPASPSVNPFDLGALRARATLASTGKHKVTRTITNTNPFALGSVTNRARFAKKTTNGKSHKNSTTTPASSPTTGTTAVITAPTTTTTVNAPAPTTTTTFNVPAPTTTTTVASPPPTTTTTTASGPAPQTAFPIGNVDASEPSGYSPPSANAMAGYTQSYVTDFTGTSLPSGWGSYSGTPGGDPGAQFGSAHTVVGGGILSLNAWQDSAYNNEWVTGGLCQCGLPQTYGAYFVRSRLTGAGPTGVELLFPTQGWPPEIDFNETGGQVTSTTATNIWAVSGSSRSQAQVSLSIDMTQWHTWGVVWTPTSITYTVDGRVWGSFTNASEVPDVPMTLDLQQQTWCSSGYACPTTPQSMQVDWVAEYTQN